MEAKEDFPTKLFYKITEVAEIVGVEAYVLRYWETKFPMLKPERYGNDERRYRRKDVELLLRIRRLLYNEKYTIAGAIERLKKDPRGVLDSVKDAAELSSLEAQLEFLGDEAVEASGVLGRLRSLKGELVELRDSLEQPVTA